MLARLGVTGSVQCESTIRRCLQRLVPNDLDQLIGQWMWLRTTTICGRRVIVFDGKTLGGARDAAGNLAHLLTGLCQTTGTVSAQLAVGAKTNEIPMLRELLDTIDITDAVITADALHCSATPPRPLSRAAATRLGLLDFDQGLVAPMGIVERGLELCWWSGFSGRYTSSSALAQHTKRRELCVVSHSRPSSGWNRTDGRVRLE